MNRSGNSKATATTLCQKCLRRGHYSFECTAARQERPYVPRPSRTQQLLNPKLAPKIVEASVKNAESKELQVQNDSRSTRKREEASIDESVRKRSRSLSPSGSESVSTISTNLSRSPSRSGSRDRPLDSRGNRDHDSSPRRQSTGQDTGRSRVESRDGRITESGNFTKQSERTRRRRSSASTGSSTEAFKDRRNYLKRRRSRSRSPTLPRRSKDARFQSRSPHRRVGFNDDRTKSTGYSANPASTNSTKRSHNRERSLSPYSKRVALSQANT